MGKKNTEEALSDETDKLVREIIAGGVDGIIGGFPCQDISTAGKGAGIQYEQSTGEAFTRSGLWGQLVRTIRLVRPRYAVLENVAAILSRGVGIVFGDLAESGYDAEWDCLPAQAFGAPHQRDRFYAIAFDPTRTGKRREAGNIFSEDGRPFSELSQQSNGSTAGGEDSYNGSKRVQRFFPQQIQRQPEFSWCEDVRRVEDFFTKPHIPEPLLCRINNGAAKRLHGIGNCNPPCVIRELTRGLGGA
jgi:DNA (cytosine-5)-methyltransferase 1